MGWVLLNNEHTLLHRGNDSIALIGVENEGEPPFSQHGDLPKAQAGTNGLFKLLLSHNPTHWRREVLPESDIDLMLVDTRMPCSWPSDIIHLLPDSSGMGRHVQRRQPGTIRKRRDGIRRTAFPFRGMAGDYRDYTG